jgi:hypothetical protein
MSRTDDTYLKQLQARYRKASKNEKTVILDEYVKTTGYHRKHATAVLNGRRERVQRPIRRPRRTQYGVEEANALATLAICSTTYAPSDFGQPWMWSCRDCTKLALCPSALAATRSSSE